MAMSEEWRRVVVLAVLATASAATIAPACGANSLLPGTYNQVSPMTKHIQRVGNEIVIARDRRGHIVFSLNAIRLSDNNMGYISGTLQHDTSRVVWTNRSRDSRCRLTFVPLAGTALQVTQDARFGDCGFGYGVLADGRYVRTKSGGKLGSWNGP